MIDLAEIFSSKARTKVLRTLYYQAEPIPLRHVATISDLPVFSIQCALKALVGEKIIKRKKRKKYTLFSLNEDHPCYQFLSKVFHLEMTSCLQADSDQYHKKAKSVLAFAASARRLFRQIKKV